MEQRARPCSARHRARPIWQLVAHLNHNEIARIGVNQIRGRRSCDANEKNAPTRTNPRYGKSAGRRASIDASDRARDRGDRERRRGQRTASRHTVDGGASSSAARGRWRVPVGGGHACEPSLGAVLGGRSGGMNGARFGAIRSKSINLNPDKRIDFAPPAPMLAAVAARFGEWADMCREGGDPVSISARVQGLADEFATG